MNVHPMLNGSFVFRSIPYVPLLLKVRSSSIAPDKEPSAKIRQRIFRRAAPTQCESIGSRRRYKYTMSGILVESAPINSENTSEQRTRKPAVNTEPLGKFASAVVFEHALESSN